MLKCSFCVMASFNGRHLTAFLKENLLQYCCSTIGLHLPPSFTFFLQDFFIFFAKRHWKKPMNRQTISFLNFCLHRVLRCGLHRSSSAMR